jgi:hypothetical protein
MSLDPAQPNIPEDDGFSPDRVSETDAPTAGPFAGTGQLTDGRRRHYVGRHRRAGRCWPRVVRSIARFWPAALRAGLLLTILITGTTAFAAPVRFGAQLLLIVMEVWVRKG